MVRPEKGKRYKTCGGFNASIWDRGKNLLGEECWRGTVEGIGFNTWDDDGRDLNGDDAFDLERGTDGD